MTTSRTYPEHEKLSAINDKSQAIGAFLESDEHPYVLAEWHGKKLQPVHKSLQVILAEYFDIDLHAIEAEKQQMIADMMPSYEE